MPNKTTLPRWADVTANVTAEPPSSKKDVGWVAQEMPPFQWFNWLFLKVYQWIVYLRDRVDQQQHIFLRSSADVIWTGSQLEFTQPIEIIFREGANTFVNRIPVSASPIVMNNGQVLVIRKDNTQALDLVAQGVYANLTTGQFCVVDESSLSNINPSNEVILFRIRSAQLENLIYGEKKGAGRKVFDIDIDASQVTTGQFANARISQGSVTQHQSALNISASQVFGTYDHGSQLSGLGDDDHPQYAHLSKAGQTFLVKVSGQTPTSTEHLSTKGYVDGKIPSIYSTAKAWVYAILDNSGGTTAIVASYNIDVPTGIVYIPATLEYKFTLDHDMSTANYVVVATCDEWTVSGDRRTVCVTDKTTSTFNVKIYAADDSPTNVLVTINIVVFGVFS